MSVAWVGTSVSTAIAFGESGAEALAAQLDGFTRLVSSDLPKAELRATRAREKSRLSGKRDCGERLDRPG